MRIFFLVISILSFLFASSQKYALIDINTKLPILYTDSVSVEQVSRGYFPIEKSSIDTFLANLNYIYGLIKQGTRAKMESFDLISGITKLTVKRVPYAYGDRYEVVAESKAGEVKAISSFINHQKSERSEERRVGKECCR